MREAARGVHLGILVVLSSALLLVLLAAVAQSGGLPQLAARFVGYLTACPHRTITGLPCPLCGATTAAVLLIQGHLSRSLAVHPLPLLLAPLLVVQIGYRAFRTARPALCLKEETVFLLAPLLLGGVIGVFVILEK